jgi:ABC-2 type transport system permease protein
MKEIWRYIKDEANLIYRDKGMFLLVVIALPLYTLIYSLAYGSEVVRDVPIAIVDDDDSSESRSLIKTFATGPGTMVNYKASNMQEAQELFYSKKISGIVYIPHGFESSIMAGREANIGLILDGSHLLLYRQVLEQITKSTLQHGAMVELSRLIKRDIDPSTAKFIIEPIAINIDNVYNDTLGYGTFVMPSVVMVIIQQTLLIGLAMAGAQRDNKKRITAKYIIAKVLVYTTIYGINLIFILGFIWNIFGFANIGNTLHVTLFLILYIISTLSLAMLFSQLFHKRESPLMLLLWSSVPVLLLAGVSYPREAFPEWLFDIGRLLPSSSGVNGFIALASRGATLSEIREEVFTLVILTIIYITLTIFINKIRLNKANF